MYIYVIDDDVDIYPSAGMCFTSNSMYCSLHHCLALGLLFLLSVLFVVGLHLFGMETDSSPS